MKELILVIVTSLMVLGVWIGTETKNITHQTFIPKDLLEISAPIDGTISAEYLKNLRISAL